MRHWGGRPPPTAWPVGRSGPPPSFPSLVSADGASDITQHQPTPQSCPPAACSRDGLRGHGSGGGRQGAQGPALDGGIGD